ncbi:MAG TPA: methyltransferase MtaB domain-containing protein [Armatimonadota bacterium]|nr:methyltransferase MtaB domain-containing protein [Armatimonadota bacterium]
MQAYSHLAITRLDDFIYGKAPYPVTTRSGLVLGGGIVYPEINFTLPRMEITAETMPQVRAQYTEMIEGVCSRAVALGVPGLVVEFELLPPLTSEPEWGAEITSLLRGILDRFAADEGLKSALRVTPVDLRDQNRPPQMRRGDCWEQMLRSFDLNAGAGADLLSIESVGGKEVHDDGILNADIPSVALALGVLASRDMAFLWKSITRICDQYGVIPAGDSSCGFGNTAMVLAEKRYIPRVWAAIIRVMTVPRALVAHEQGARGPGKDCAYENPYLKAITGCPISAEGADAACAHFSPVGNIGHATADLWSNESVQNVRLLGGMAPTVSMEQLAYTTRLMNTATASSGARTLRDWYVESDSALDPQAYVLRPDVVVDLAREIIAENTPYRRTRRAAIATAERLRQAAAKGSLRLGHREAEWLDRLSGDADDLPEEEETLIETVSPLLERSKVHLEEYEIAMTAGV